MAFFGQGKGGPSLLDYLSPATRAQNRGDAGDDGEPRPRPGPPAPSEPGTTLACIGGRCQYVDIATPEAIQACNGKNVGDSCATSPYVYVPVEGECPEGKGKTYEGCPCGEAYGTKKGTCATGYRFVQREPWAGKKDGVTYAEGMVGTCHCEKAISDWKANKGQGLGEYQWPSELEDLYNQLIGRGSELLNRKPGYSDAILNLMFGKNFEKIRGLETGTRESVLGNLSREGYLGTPTAQRMLGQTAWGTESNVANVRRDIATLQADRELNDLLSQTEGARGLFGTGVGFKQALEAINAGRRGEGRDAMAMFMQWLMSLLSSWAA